ncbi:MAG: AarF/UbiB family protein [Nitrospirae bacterium]|nr:AarF/UbiB family protein [Nitrospirota bacterium]
MASVFTYVRSTKRFAQILFILGNHYVFRLPYHFKFDPSAKYGNVISKYLMPKKKNYNAPDVAREALVKLGPTYIKLGQFLSLRPDLVPLECCTEFKKLQDQVPPFPFAEVKTVLESELGKDYAEIFSEFDETPVAAASISQVHRARLRTGEEVAVKVQRPGIREETVSNILIMMFFAEFLERFFPSIRKNRPVMLIREFSRWTDRELYFRQEGKNALHFAYHFKDYPGVSFPRIYRDLTTRKVLVMEYLRGVNVLKAPLDEIDRKVVARLIADSMLKQILVDGFFHGDPHAGNIFLLKNNTIAYLDCGIVGYLPEDMRAWTLDILYGMSEEQVTRITDSFLELCNVNSRDIDLVNFRRRMNEVLSEMHIIKAAGIPFSHMMERLLNTCLDFGIIIPNEFVVMSKAITTLEGTCLSLDPEINLVEYMSAFVQKTMTTAPKLDDVQKLLKAIPFEAKRLKQLVSKYGARAISLLDQPASWSAANDHRSNARGTDRSGLNIAHGFIIASLIFAAAILSNESGFEKWLESVLHLPDLPVLPILSLAGAGYLWMRLSRRNRSLKV